MRFSRCSKMGASSSRFRFPGPVSAEGKGPRLVNGSLDEPPPGAQCGAHGRPRDTQRSRMKR